MTCCIVPDKTDVVLRLIGQMSIHARSADMCVPQKNVTYFTTKVIGQMSVSHVL